MKTDWSVVEIEDFVNITQEAEELPWQPPISLERGKTGVFDLEDIVTLLRATNAFDIVAMKLPPKIQLGDYMVLCSARSVRHLTAIAEDIQWIYKRRVNKPNSHLKVEGERTEWQAMDIGNIILHLFLPKVREKYDLESLWTVGPEFDGHCKQESDPYVYSVDDLPWLRELETGQNMEKRHVKETEDTEKQASRGKVN